METEQAVAFIPGGTWKAVFYDSGQKQPWCNPVFGFVLYNFQDRGDSGYVIAPQVLSEGDHFEEPMGGNFLGLLAPGENEADIERLFAWQIAAYMESVREQKRKEKEAPNAPE